MDVHSSGEHSQQRLFVILLTACHAQGTPELKHDPQQDPQKPTKAAEVKPEESKPAQEPSDDKPPKEEPAAEEKRKPAERQAAIQQPKTLQSDIDWASIEVRPSISCLITSCGNRWGACKDMLSDDAGLSLSCMCKDLGRLLPRKPSLLPSTSRAAAAVHVSSSQACTASQAMKLAG